MLLCNMTTGSSNLLSQSVATKMATNYKLAGSWIIYELVTCRHVLHVWKLKYFCVRIAGSNAGIVA